MVYLIENPERNICKIGCSENPEARLMALQTATPDKLVLSAVLAGSYEQEKELHLRFAESRLGGEWFSLTPEILAHFNVERSFMLFEAMVMFLKHVDGAQVKTWLWMALNCQTNKNTIVMSAEAKERASKEMNIAIGTIDNSLRKLIELGVMARVGKGHYFLSPTYTWRGDLRSLEKAEKIYLKYTIGKP